MQNAIALSGFAAVLGIAYALSCDRQRIHWRTPAAALALELAIAVAVFLAPTRHVLFGSLNRGILKVIDCADDGIVFLFGYLAEAPPGKFSLLAQALPLIIFFSAFISLLYHVGVMQKIVKALAAVFCRAFGISGAEALVAASNIFVGIESALTVRPYLARMTTSELFLILTVGMSTIASSVLALYVMALNQVFPTIAAHLVSATVLSAPAAVCIAKIMVPETEGALTAGKVVEPEYKRATNAVESVLNGANEGAKMVLGISAALIAFIGLVSVANLLLTTLGRAPNALLPVPMDWTIQGILAFVYYPITVCLGVPIADAFEVSRLIADRLVQTEVSSYFALADLIRAGALQPRSVLIASYVLCGFAHVASLAIFVGGTAALAPEKLPLLSRLGARALIAANLACLMTGAAASLFYHSDLAVITVG